MKKTSRAPASERSHKRPLPTRAKRPRIPEPLRFVQATKAKRGGQRVELPTLILRGEWLKAAGLPVGAGCYLTTDRRGELALHRLGLGVPRRLMIVAKCAIEGAQYSRVRARATGPVRKSIRPKPHS